MVWQPPLPHPAKPWQPVTSSPDEDLDQEDEQQADENVDET